MMNSMSYKNSTSKQVTDILLNCLEFSTFASSTI